MGRTLMARTFNGLVNDVRIWNVEVGHVDENTRRQREVWLHDHEVRMKAVDLIEEEVNELREAVEDEDEVEVVDALADILFTVFGLANKSGYDMILEKAFREVVRSNMTKITGDKESGRVKIGKPEGYIPPDIAGIIQQAEEIGYL